MSVHFLCRSYIIHKRCIRLLHVTVYAYKYMRTALLIRPARSCMSEHISCMKKRVMELIIRTIMEQNSTLVDN